MNPDTPPDNSAPFAEPIASPRGTTRWTDHVGTGITVGYLILIAIGMFHSALGYRHFGINILDYAEASDFLLAPFHDPVVFLVTVIPIVLAWVYMVTFERFADRQVAKRKAEGKPKRWWESSDETNERFRSWRPFMRLGLGVFWLFVSTSIYQQGLAFGTMRGEGTRVELELTDGRMMVGTEARPLSLIGTTGRYVFVFRSDVWRTEVIPTENVKRLIPLGTLPKRTRDRRERYWRRLDSAAVKAK